MKSSYFLLLVVYIVLILVSFLLPFYTAPGYSIISHTLSELGAQNTPNNWMMNFVFILLSFITLIHGFKILGNHPLQIIVLFIFCTSLLLTGIYLSAPIYRRLPFDSFQDEMHSIFSTTTGVSFFIYCLVISYIARWRKQKILAIIVGITTFILSYSMFIHAPYSGLYQRGIFIIAFGWILYSFKYYDLLFSKKEYFNLVNKKKNER
ncbi:DUF998 domain-containing protein [Aquimarina addita]|uniref:DUF998 domain-containing protein n=1 Tax=Aquimarina addita TaxID=870485 RepID=UPI0031EB9721